MCAFRGQDNDSRCLRCYQRREICICSILPTVQTRAEFLVLQHVHEAGSPGNTGRLVALSMPNSRIVPFGGGARIMTSPVFDELLQPGTYLLWPDGTVKHRDKSALEAPDRVVVLDATWRQARKLYSRMPVLRSLPQLALPAPDRHRDRLREQHRVDGMSTLEAVAAAVNQLEGAQRAEPLESLYDEVVRRTTALRWGVKPE